jgi:hypothetical protein
LKFKSFTLHCLPTPLISLIIFHDSLKYPNLPWIICLKYHCTFLKCYEIAAQMNKYTRLLTLNVIANEVGPDSRRCWTAFECSAKPFWNVVSTCSNMALQDISNAGTTVVSKLDLSASYIWNNFTLMNKNYLVKS